MGFPTFSNERPVPDCAIFDHVLEHLGSPQDDHEPVHTSDVMLLESKCLFGERSVLADPSVDHHLVLPRLPDHQATFEPWFLLNDIGRFWKTLLLNYEHKRNQPGDEGADAEQGEAEGAELQAEFSRMTTCFATIAALG